MSDTDRPAPTPLTRRAVVATTGAVWAAPVVTTLAAAPAFAASAGRAAAITAVTPSTTYVTDAATASGVTLTAKVTDVNGAAVAGAVVTFALTPDAEWPVSFGSSASAGVLTATATTNAAGVASAAYSYAKPTRQALLETTASVSTPSGTVSTRWSTRFRGWVLPLGGRPSTNGGAATFAIAGSRPFTWGNAAFRGTSRTATDYVPAPMDLVTGSAVAVWAGSWSGAGASGAYQGWAVLQSDGSVIVGAGTESGEQLGNGPRPTSAGAMVRRPDSDLPAAAAPLGVFGYFHQAVIADGTVYVCGLGQSGELGNGTVAAVGAPASVMRAVSSSPSNGSELPAGRATAVAISGFGNQNSYPEAVVAIADGRLFGWGSEAYLAAGSSATTARSVPKALVTASVNTAAAGVTFTQVSGGSAFFVALGVKDGVTGLYAWGSGASSGRLGNGSTTDANGFRIAPVSVLPSGRTWVKVVAGASGAMVLSSTGEVWTWGGLRPGNGDAAPNAGLAVRLQVAGRRFTDIAVGYNSLQLALADDGTLYTWNGALNTGVTGTQTTVGSGTLAIATPVITTNVMAD
ncbi:hypothetical protein K8Z61_10645 [Nocardioides sp. TRM66260-LWL]|uniref:hypothetical protein n=1 Tax=Nocardioides sp. TRM66260-LWL TaxID=2874478 RepID=UPI001CC4B1B5|nr:hypothetical protein [Nocardioides sp. TRM66260-LWL]MBZ5734955.1 hypothetical protein [Nocardioides sp. TRM66260-LWL]